MGYRSNFLLTAKPMTEDLYQRISDELKQYVPYIMCECMEDGAGVWLNEDDTWYSCQSDMIQLSKDFPDTFFELSVEGENHNDDWRAYFSDGKYQVNDALVGFRHDDRHDGDLQHRIRRHEQFRASLCDGDRVRGADVALYRAVLQIAGFRRGGNVIWDTEATSC